MLKVMCSVPNWCNSLILPGVPRITGDMLRDAMGASLQFRWFRIVSGTFSLGVSPKARTQ